MTSFEDFPWDPAPRQQSFRPDAAAAAAARRFAQHTLTDWAIAERLDDVRLCLSELVANAVVHGGAEADAILVRFSVSDHLLRLEVHDSAAALPEQNLPADDAESGRGLLLVAACADAWGVEPHPGHKAVWAEFEVAAAAMPALACPAAVA
ncbi:ATP-binding protein [Streptomyces sp. NRRL S-813]|uniref:ATP-binding protein n=1 Tax=Streptomyces sp. NRRL S-813 TaxID=1463919 RepID=UPI00099BD29F|nr:ATP-binding protein [Streptomyces sp. NRRL S-813]